MKSSKVLLNISAFVCYLYGALYIFTLVFIPLGVYCFIAARRFSFKADHLMDTYTVGNKTLRNYIIFASIACFPLGLISIIPYYLLNSKRVKVLGDGGEFKTETSSSPDMNNYAENVSNDENVVDDKTSDLNSETAQTENITVESSEPETMAEKQEKFKKLQNFKEKGLITDEELEMARVQLFGKDENKN